MEEMEGYIPRLADEHLEFLLKTSGAVYIKGPKWCGKSTTAKKHAKSCVYMQDKMTQDQSKALAKNSPSIFLKGDTPRLIDEWQSIPFIWDSIRFEIDQRNKFGQFLLTGSVVPNDEDNEEREHSGAGRIVPMVLRTMSLFESKDSTGEVSLKQLFDGKDFEAKVSDLSLEDYSYLICRGGWPTAVVHSEKDTALQQVRNYYSVLISEDFQRMRKKKRGTEKISAVMMSYARNTATNASIATICRDISVAGEKKIDEDTVRDYLYDLDALFVKEELPAWNPNLRSKTTVNCSPVRHFIDPSIGCAALDIWPEDLINDLETMGLFFESMVIRDLRIYAERFRGHVYHYRDGDGLEADAVIRTNDGRWAAIEVKLCDSDRIEEGAKHLLELKDKVRLDRHQEPEFLMVVTATNYAYRREDGVFVVPLGCLGP